MRLPPDPGLRDPRTLPAHHPAGLGDRALGQARAQSATMARRSERTRSSSTRRFAGSASTPVGSSRASRSSRPTPVSRSRSRTCIRGGPRSASSRRTPPAGTRSTRTTPTSRIDLSHSSTSGSDPIQMVRRARAPAAPHPSRRRHRFRQGRAPDPGPGHPALRRAAGTACDPGVRRQRGHRDQHPQGSEPGSPTGRHRGVAGVHPAALRRIRPDVRRGQRSGRARPRSRRRPWQLSARPQRRRPRRRARVPDGGRARRTRAR